MRITIILATIACFARMSAGDIIYDNIEPNGGVNYLGFPPPSQLDMGFGFDAGAADDFNLPTSSDESGDWLVTGLSWSGKFTSTSGPPPSIAGFRIIFWPQDLNQPQPAGGTASGPPDYSQALAIYSDVSATSTPGAGGENDFDYTAALPNPFLAEDEKPYWLEIQAQINFPPLWNWQHVSGNLGAQPKAGMELFGTPFWSATTTTFDLAFVLEGTEAPEPGTLTLAGFAALLAARRTRRGRRLRRAVLQ